MTSPDEQNLLDLWDKNICPMCGKVIAEGTRVGSGKKGEGGFCSLDCYGEYYKKSLIERHNRVIESQRRNSN